MASHKHHPKENDFDVTNLKVDVYGYDERGRYWGYIRGKDVWRVERLKDGKVFHVRATSKKQAIAKVFTPKKGEAAFTRNQGNAVARMRIVRGIR